MKYSDAQKEATMRYNKKTYEHINLVVRKGQRQMYKNFAASKGKSLNRFFLDLADAEMQKEKETE